MNDETQENNKNTTHEKQIHYPIRLLSNTFRAYFLFCYVFFFSNSIFEPVTNKNTSMYYQLQRNERNFFFFYRLADMNNLTSLAPLTQNQKLFILLILQDT